MNLAESMKFVLKTKSQDIFTNFWKEDFQQVLKEVIADLFSLTRKRKRPFRLNNFKNTIKDSKETLQEIFQIVKVIPHRMNSGFRFFKEDFLHELDDLEDSKQKTIFCLKVLGSFSRFTLSTLFEMRKADKNFWGIGKYRNIYTQFIMTSLILRLSHLFLLRFLNEVEKEMHDPEDLNSLMHFKSVMSNKSSNTVEKIFEGINGADDKASAMVNSLKRYILTGERDHKFWTDSPRSL